MQEIYQSMQEIYQSMQEIYQSMQEIPKLAFRIESYYLSYID